MPKPVPRLRLSHGQAAWALALGRPPDEKLLEQLRYLRQIGIPFNKSELGVGRGQRVEYGFEHLMEAGAALKGLQRGMKPKDVAAFLVGNRKALQRIYRRAYLNAPEGALEQDWVKTRGQSIPGMKNELWLRLHERFSEPGKIDVLRMDEVKDLRDALSMVERYPGEELRMLLPLTRLALELVAWAKEAPETRPGPQ
jgi:hypothetical protein